MRAEARRVGKPLSRACRPGATLGWSNRHSESHFYRSLLEGVAFELVRIVRELERMFPGSALPRIVVGGGGARSEAWRGILSDVVGYTVCVPEEPESTALGAAILAGVGLGAFRDTREACAAMVRMRGSRVPDPANFARYRTIFEEVYLPFSAVSLGLSARLRAIAESGRG